MKSRLFIVAVILCLTVLFAACNDSSPKNVVNEVDVTYVAQPVSDYVLETVAVKDDDDIYYEYADVEAFPVSVRYGAAELSQGYKSLTLEAQRTIYAEMEENVYYIAQEPSDGMYDLHDITIWGEELTEAQLRQVIVAFCQDKPHIFWMDNKFGYANTSGRTVLQLYSFLSADDVEAYTAELNEKVRELHLGLFSDMTEYDRELYVHDWLVENCNYADDVFKISDDFLSFTSYGAMVNNKAVCEGYTRAMQMMLATVGVESFPIVGIGNDGLHMWNAVKVENEWYYLDPTWNDTEKGSGYDYFNLTTDQILYDHTILPVYSQLSEEQVCGSDDGQADSFNIIVPVCSGTSQNYFVKNSMFVSTVSDATKANIKRGLRKAQGELTETVFINVSPDLDYDETLDSLFYSGDYVFFECLDDVNEEFEDNFIDRNNVSISKKPHLRIVTVILQYTDER